MAITITKGYTFGSTELVTNTKLHTLVDSSIIDASDPGAIGGTTPAAGDFTTLIGTNIDGIIGANTPAAGDFTTLACTTITGDGSALTDIDAVKNDGTVNPTNLLSNGDFESWSAGTAAAPDGWTKSAGGTVTINQEDTIIKLGTYSAKLYRGAQEAYLEQAIHTDKGIAYWQGRTVTFGAWVYRGAAAGISKITVYDGVARVTVLATLSEEWEWLSATIDVDASATELTAELRVDTNGATAYFDGAMLVEGASAFAFADKPAGEGVWTDYFGSSTIVGWSNETGTIYTKKIGNTVFVKYNLAGTSDSTLATFTLPYAASEPTISLVRTVNVGNQANVGVCTITASTVDVKKDIASFGFTASNPKTVQGQFFYEAA